MRSWVVAAVRTGQERTVHTNWLATFLVVLFVLQAQYKPFFIQHSSTNTLAFKNISYKCIIMIGYIVLVYSKLAIVVLKKDL